MPELPEVEVVRLGLEPAVAGAVITGVEVFDERSLRRHDTGTGAFDGLLLGSRMSAPARRGKFLWVPLLAESEDSPVRALLVHLGMSGQLLLREPGAVDRHLRIRLMIEHPGRGEAAVHFVDQRIFGSMAVDPLVPAADNPDEQIPAQVRHIARDPLDPRFDDRRFLAALATRSSGIKRVLLDQTVISGIGNIYADEALWAARLHYDRSAASLSPAQSRRLLAEVRSVLQRALAEGGTSFDAHYVNVNGQSGYFARSLNAYGRTGQPCPRCGTPILREVFMNRSSHRCPHCQR